MNRMSISVVILFLISSVGRISPMHHVYQTYKKSWYQNQLTELHKAIPADVKEEIINQALNQSEGPVEATKQLAKFSKLSKEWNGVVTDFANSNAFKEYEERGICINPYPIFHIIGQGKVAATELLKNGIQSNKVMFYYMQTDEMTFDGKNPGIFLKGELKTCAILVNPDKVIVHNGRIPSFDPGSPCKDDVMGMGKYKKSGMPLSRYIEQRKKGKELHSNIGKFVYYDSITAEPIESAGAEDSVLDDLSYSSYHSSPEILLESSILATRLVKQFPEKLIKKSSEHSL